VLLYEVSKVSRYTIMVRASEALIRHTSIRELKSGSGFHAGGTRKLSLDPPVGWGRWL
jgi:hypothetical protein